MTLGELRYIVAAANERSSRTARASRGRKRSRRLA